jgi:MFS family permease
VARSPYRAFAGIFGATLLTLMAVGAVLPVLPHYVKGPLGYGSLAVGFAVGAFAFTALASRPVAGHVADSRGRRPVVAVGAALAAIAGALYFVPAGLPGLILARLVLGAGEGTVFTAGATWVVDLAPLDRRARVIGLYGLAVWGGLSLGPLIGSALFAAGHFNAVWAFCAISPAIGALVALVVPDPFEPSASSRRRQLIVPESVRPGLALSMATIGYAAMASFIVLDLNSKHVGHGATAFAAFATTVVVTRAIGGDLPDRLGPVRCAAGAASVSAVGLALIALAHSLALALAGAIGMGLAFALIYPSLSLVVVNSVPDSRRGSALGTFTAFFDIGFAVGGPLTGLAASLGGYSAAFWLGSAFALGAIGVAGSLRRRAATLPTPAPG